MDHKCPNYRIEVSCFRVTCLTVKQSFEYMFLDIPSYTLTTVHGEWYFLGG